MYWGKEFAKDPGKPPRVPPGGSCRMFTVHGALSNVFMVPAGREAKWFVYELVKVTNFKSVCSNNSLAR